MKGSGIERTCSSGSSLYQGVFTEHLLINPFVLENRHGNSSWWQR